MATLTAVPEVQSSFRALPGVPRWARWAAHGVALVNVPSGLWRLGLAVGIPFGLAQSEMDQLGAPGWGSAFLVMLSVVSEVFAFLAFGLVQPWGEIWPRWVPFVGGRPIPVLGVVVSAAVGTVATTIYGVAFVYTTLNAEMAGTAWAMWIINATYLPLLLWGPLLGALTVHYHRRRNG